MKMKTTMSTSASTDLMLLITDVVYQLGIKYNY